MCTAVRCEETGFAVMVSPSTTREFSAPMGTEQLRFAESHISQRARDTPNFLYAALDMTACAPFYKERRMRLGDPNDLRRKSGRWGTPVRCQGKNHKGRLFLRLLTGPLRLVAPTQEITYQVTLTVFST